MATWLLLLAASVGTGVIIVGLLVAPSRWQPSLGALLAATLVACARAVDLLSHATRGPEPLIAATVFAVAGVTGGYWVSAAAILGLPGRPRSTSPVLAAPVGTSPRPRRVAAVIISPAEPERYGFGTSYRRLRRLTDSGALTLPTSAVPFVFLAEKTRYRAIHRFHPARATATVLAEAVQARLQASGHAERVVNAWCDGGPSLGEQVRALAAEGFTDVVACVLGNDGTYLIEEALRDLTDTRIDGVRVLHAPGVWHSDALAVRLCERIMRAAGASEPHELGIALLGEGQPPQWEAASREWREKETYFTQRVRLMLEERGVSGRNVRQGWLEWQTPDATEVIRHLAAMGCSHVIAVPATIPVATLSTALDLPRAIDNARLSDGTHATVVPPWGDDAVLVEVLTSCIKRAVNDAA